MKISQLLQTTINENNANYLVTDVSNIMGETHVTKKINIDYLPYAKWDNVTVADILDYTDGSSVNTIMLPAIGISNSGATELYNTTFAAFKGWISSNIEVDSPWPQVYNSCDAELEYQDPSAAWFPLVTGSTSDDVAKVSIESLVEYLKEFFVEK